MRDPCGIHEQDSRPASVKLKHAATAVPMCGLLRLAPISTESVNQHTCVLHTCPLPPPPLFTAGTWCPAPLSRATEGKNSPERQSQAAERSAKQSLTFVPRE